MSQQDALLAAVRADPDDDTARLAYADWLEETGGADESRRAEFIRVQIERARLPPDDPRQSGLEARERRLMVPHALDWVGPLAGRCRPWAFRRGFLDGVTLDPRTFAADAPALFAAHPVRALRLTGWPARVDVGPSARDLAEQIAGRPELARVRRLALGENIPFDEAPAGSLVAVVSSLHLTGLTELAVGHDFLPAEDLAVLPTLPVVARLDALDLPVGACPSAALAGLADAAVNLRRLRLALGEDVTPAGLGAFLASPLAARLTDLELRAGGGLFRWDAVPGLAELLPRPRLRRLALVGPGPAPVAALTAAPSWGAVSSLSLARCRLPPAAWGALLACPHLAGLTELDLRGTGVTDRQVEELAACPRLANLTRLDLSSCPVRDRGARALAGSPFLRRLTDLSLNSVGLTGAGATALVGSANLADLRRLDLRGHDIGGLTLEALAGSPHLGRLTTLLFAGRGWAGDDAVLALAGSANLPCLTLIDRLNISEYWSTEEGIQALLDARALTWPGLAEHDLRTDAQRAAFADRFRGVYWPPLLDGGLGAGW